MFCHSCGTQVPDNVQFCPTCGASMPTAPNPFASPAPVAFVAPTGIKAEPGRWTREAWEIVKADMGNYVLIALVFWLINGVAGGLLAGPLTAGFHIYTLRKMLGRPAEFADLFKGFNFFVPALVAGLLIGIFTGLATLLCIIPGLVVAAMYKFTYLFIVDKRMDFWPAMQASHEVVKNDYFGFTMFLLLLALINFLGFLCCIVGLLVTMPLTVAAITVAYKELIGLDQRTVDAI